MVISRTANKPTSPPASKHTHTHTASSYIPFPLSFLLSLLLSQSWFLNSLAENQAVRGWSEVGLLAGSVFVHAGSCEWKADKHAQRKKSSSIL